MQYQEKIIQAIAAYLEHETYFSETLINDQKTRQFMRINVLQSHSDFCQEIARELAAAIAPHLEAETDLPYSELFGHMSNEHGLTLTNTELGDIIHVARATPVPRVGEELKIGDRVEIIALLDHSPVHGHEAPIGYEGYITYIDSADFELPYQVDMLHWVSRNEIKLI